MKKLKLFLSALILSVSSLGMLVAPHVFAAAKAWTGTAGDHKFSTAGNWSPSGAPSNGDSLTFDNTSVTDLLPNDDQTSASYASITFQGTGTSSFTIGGNAFTLTGGITNTETTYFTINNNITITGNQTFAAGSQGATFAGNLSGTGNINKTGTGNIFFNGSNGSYSGTATINAGQVYLSAATSLPNGVINDGAEAVISGCSPFDYSGNLTLTGASVTPTGDAATPKLGVFMGLCSGGATDESYGTRAGTGTPKLTGNITLGSDITFATTAASATLTGGLSGAHAINLLPGYGSSLIVAASSNTSSTANGTYGAPAFTKTLSDDQSAHSVGISGNTIIILDGKRGDINVNSGATLEGSGSTNLLAVNTGGTVAPGHSPGCLTVGAGLVLAGTYKAEIGGTTACSGYDQLKVTGTVTLTGGALSLSRYNNFKPAAGQKYTIIDNDGTDAVVGTFTSLAEGATTTVDGYVFKVSYVGGDGNDVVVTVMNVPSTPNTGVALIKNNPLVSAVVMVGAAAGIALAARAGRRPSARRRS